jgi:serine/threonine-protein phosphatase 2B regulatory subunit
LLSDPESCTLAPAQEFVRILAAFSARASREDRVRFLFDVYDMDGDGVVSREDLELILRQLAGTSLRCGTV